MGRKSCQMMGHNNQGLSSFSSYFPEASKDITLYNSIQRVGRLVEDDQFDALAMFSSNDCPRSTADSSTFAK